MYGDIPTVKINNIRHITKSGTKCLCGLIYFDTQFTYRAPKPPNIIFRDISDVTCKECLNILNEEKGRSGSEGK